MSGPAQQVADAPVGIRPPGSSGPRRRWSRRRQVVAAAGLLAAVLVVVSVVVAVTRSSAPPAGSQVSSGYAATCLAVGVAVNPPGTQAAPATAAFQKAQKALGPVTIRRSFDSSLPASFAQSAAAGDAKAGLHSFVSWKPPGGDFRGATQGKYDRQIGAWAKSVPRTGVFATAWHEPENDMTAAQFVAFQRHVYGVVKAANSTIHWGPVYMAYWWDPGQPKHYVGDPGAWWPGDGYADFAAIDWYGATPEPMSTSPSFLNWYRAMLPHHVPLLITEYGQYVLAPGQQPQPALEQARADAIRQDAAWVADHPALRMWVYWQGVGPRGDWRMHDKASEQAWRSVAGSGCPA